MAEEKCILSTHENPDGWADRISSEYESIITEENYNEELLMHLIECSSCHKVFERTYEDSAAILREAEEQLMN